MKRSFLKLVKKGTSIHAFWLVTIIGVSGCTHTVALKDSVAVYAMPLIQGAPKIILSDVLDNRSDKKTLGQVGGLTLAESDTPINVILTNRIASRLRDEGFNIQKTNLTKPGDIGELKNLLKSSSGNVFLSGGLSNFFMSSFDAILETGKGNVTFYIDAFDNNGHAIFNGRYSAYAEHWIGLTGQFGSEKLIEMSLEASVDELFKDSKFKDLFVRVRK